MSELGSPSKSPPQDAPASAAAATSSTARTDVSQEDIDLSIRFQQLMAMFAPKKRKQLKDYQTLDNVVDLITRSNKIVVLTGAGISVSCGISDFRSKGGFYDRLREAGFEEPEEIFSIELFRRDPSIFYRYAKDFINCDYVPSPTHHFLAMLEHRGKILRNYTQNIDGLEMKAGCTKVFQCHGSMGTASCVDCKERVPIDSIAAEIQSQALPGDFQATSRADLAQADLLLVIGSSLLVHPWPVSSVWGDSRTAGDGVGYQPSSQPSITIGFNCHLASTAGALPRYEPPAQVPQVLINREPVGHENHFDVMLLGNCDDVIGDLAHRLGWQLPYSRSCQPTLGRRQYPLPTTTPEPRVVVYPGGSLARIDASDSEDDDDESAEEADSSSHQKSAAQPPQPPRPKAAGQSSAPPATATSRSPVPPATATSSATATAAPAPSPPPPGPR
ncbi:putative NAD-dependent protein deacetylase sirtuin-1 [Paratrimastix pyriformis]|uniref:NAD-dependent protein deacetylase sirtuin-1 n=1 Tax=Paratrimastix pyriformis TaxID=342808 RepID=A0ABQ8U686_9EUKA|nr:putative NAD-dependent protein deacetylase sirtuin-1 [Paratrimastix pyriformis]